jgi:hypothetical protein
MNGSGKSESRITVDPTGAADFVAHVGAAVNLSVQSSSGNVVLSAVHYDANPLVIEGNRFALAIAEGQKDLVIATVRPLQEIAELADSEGSVLAHFDSDFVRFQIRGI